MSIFRCEECENLIDGDYYLCLEHPTDPTVHICELCLEELEVKDEERSGVIAASMAKFNKFMEGKE